MKLIGLVMINFYMVYRNMILYITGGITLCAIALVYVKDWKVPVVGVDVEYTVPSLLLLLSVLPAFDVLKIAHKSGYDKYIPTLPIRRETIVKSQYLFFAFAAVLGVLVTIGAILVFSQFSWISFGLGEYEDIISIFTILILTGALVFPLIYLFGSERVDIYVLAVFFAAIGFAHLMGRIGKYIVGLMNIEMPVHGIEMPGNITAFLVYSVIFALVGILIYIISIFIAIFIYRKKEL